MATVEMPMMLRADGVWHYVNQDELAIIESILTDSDRAVAITAAAMIENRIQTAILTRLVRNQKIESDVFGSNGSLGTFGAKIDLASLFGFFTDRALQDLRQVQKIRNAFAHRTDARDFQTQSIKDRTNNLSLIKTHVVSRSDKEGAFIAGPAPRSVPRMSVTDYDEKMKDSKSRYLMTAQIFILAFASAPVTHTDVPLI